MLMTGREGPAVESYSDYKHRTMKKFRNRIKELLSGINSCSLKGEDKLKLKKEIIEKINHTNP